MANNNPESNVVQLAGPGVPGMEGDAPLFHYDVPPEDLPTLLADPVKYLEQRGMGREQGIAPDGRMDILFTSANRVWDGSQWTDEDGGIEPRHVCCYVTDCQSVCVPHSHKQ
ncbi:hypothetical protein ABZ016_18980 [Streptomyces sp. NPDC006372]|uniref:hypothetical protein n=1 Tax=Streptomyces sp. NPDC006372 TaxID=3155599 RepID=UPI0033A4B6DD